MGSLIPFPIAICKECRRKYNLVENFKFYSASLGFIIGLLVVLALSPLEIIPVFSGIHSRSYFSVCNGCSLCDWWLAF